MFIGISTAQAALSKRQARSFLYSVAALGLALGLGACHSGQTSAPGAPGVEGRWSYAGKIGIGTSYEAYDNGRYSDANKRTGTVSKVWFSLAQGIVTETMYGLIHEAQLKEMQFAIVGDGFVDLERTSTDYTIDYLYKDANGRPRSLAYKVITRDKQGRYEIEKHIFTNPDTQALFVRATIRALKGSITPYLLADPHMATTSGGDQALASPTQLQAFEGNKALALQASVPFAQTTVGFAGSASDPWLDLQKDGKLDARFSQTGKTPGNVVLAGGFAPITEGQSLSVDLVLGFGADLKTAEQAASTTLQAGYAKTLAAYNGEGDAVGWEDYLASLTDLAKVQAQATDGGALAQVSALVLKAQEDKSFAGALIASLSSPWGETASAKNLATGYKAVWPRDFYQCAMALLALGDKETPLAALNYLGKVQVRANTPGNSGATGWFLQKTHVDGTREWVAVQLDQTANPIMLAWKLWQAGIVSTQQAQALYADMLKPAADFLVNGGTLGVDWNKETLTPPRTQQERWEEQPGYSPSTIAATIAGLVSAADLARLANDTPSAERYLLAATRYASAIERLTFTTSGQLGDGRYYLRITDNDNPNDKGPLQERNGQKALTEDQYLDAGFLELVRYGVRAPDHPAILASLAEIDDTRLPENLRLKYLFPVPNAAGASVPGWRRYGNDGYGEDAQTGENYAARNGQMSPGQRGRVWPFFTGERGHYELARLTQNGKRALTPAERLTLQNTYVRAFDVFANAGLMLPEQVWDGVGKNSPNGYALGEGTNSATPLAWTHAEYIKLLRSLSDGRVWDFYPNVAARIQTSRIEGSKPTPR
jgi:glucoamylase